MKAAAISIDPDTEECNWDVFTGPGAAVKAWEFVESMRGEWPNRRWAMVADEEARKELGEHRMAQVLGVGG